MRYSIGIDIGGTNTMLGLADENGQIVQTSNFKTNSFESSADYITHLSKKINEMLNDTISNTAIFELIGIGIGAPNANFYTGCIVEAPNLPWKGTIHLVDELKKKFDTNIIMTNDANAAAIGEKIYGKAKGLNDFLVVTLGTGVGSGFVTNGNILYGSTGFAGELGHTSVLKDGRPCNCGRRGCLETYCSATGIVRTVREWLSEGATSSLKDSPELSSADIYKAAIAGDELANRAFEYTGDLLGYQLAQAVAITSPSHIFLFGGLANAGDLILSPTRRSFDNHVLNIFSNTVQIEISELNNSSNAAILGAAALVM